MTQVNEVSSAELASYLTSVIGNLGKNPKERYKVTIDTEASMVLIELLTEVAPPK